MAMSSNTEAHAIAAMGLATMCNAADANGALIAKVSLPSLVRLGRSAKADTQCAALDALAVLSEQPSVQVDLVRMGALKMLLERAATSGAENADIRSLALNALQQIASNGANMAALQAPEVSGRLRGMAAHLKDDLVVTRSVSTITRSIQTISTLLELQGKRRPLRPGEVAAMLDCVGIAGIDASISREVAHTCAAIGGQRGSVDLFIAEGGLELLNNLCRSRSVGVQAECAAAIVAFTQVREAHVALAKQGSLRALVAMARSRSDELQRQVAAAYGTLAACAAPKTWIVQCGAVPHLLQFVRSADPEVQYHAARALLYCR